MDQNQIDYVVYELCQFGKIQATQFPPTNTLEYRNALVIHETNL